MYNTLAIIKEILLVDMCIIIGLKAVRTLIYFSGPDPTEFDFEFHFISYFFLG
jgi:hypothetical protein